MVEKEKITLGKGKDKETFTIKKGALHRALGYDGKFNKAELIRMNKTEVGGSFNFKGKSHKMTKLMKSRVSLAITLMGGKGKKKGGESKGDKSKTHPGDKDYTTKRGDKDFHRKGHDVKPKKGKAPYKK